MSVSFRSGLASQAIILYRKPQTPEEFVRTTLEKKTNEVFRRSLESAKFEIGHLALCPSCLGIDPEKYFDARSRHIQHILPPLEGSYRVGHSSMIVERPKTAQGDSKIGIEIYAPTNSDTKRLFLLIPGDRPIVTPQQVQSLYTHSLDTLDPIDQMPILIFSNGFGREPRDYRILLENLASHGYLVLNLNHPSSSSFAPFSDEALDEASFKETDEEFDKVAYRQADNIKFVIDKINEGLFEDCGNASQIILGGHSLGGAASVILSRDVDQIRGCINLDGRLIGNKVTRSDSLRIPVLTVLSDKHYDLKNIPQEYREEFLDYREEMVREMDELHKDSDSESSTIVEIPDVTHMDFCFSSFVEPWLLGDGSLEGPLKAHDTTSKKMLKFMDSVFPSRKNPL